MNSGLRVEISEDAAGKITCLNLAAIFCFFACFIATIVIILRFEREGVRHLKPKKGTSFNASVFRTR